MGSAEFSCPSLSAMLDASVCDVAAAVTQPDRPSGRRLQSRPSPVKVLAEAYGLPVLTPPNVNAAESLDAIRAFRPDVIAVVAYGQILRAGLLGIPPRGAINVHASLLPRYRGAAAIQWPIAAGETVTGVTTMVMDEGVDTGDIILQREVPIGETETAGLLHDRLAGEGAELLVETLKTVAAGQAPRTPQDDALASQAPKISKADGRINWTMSAVDIYNRVRAFNPWPMCFCTVPSDAKGREATRYLRVLKVRVEDGQGAPGTVLDLSAEGPLVAAGERAVRLLEVQPEGKRPMGGGDFLRGHSMQPGWVIRG